MVCYSSYWLFGKHYWSLQSNVVSCDEEFGHAPFLFISQRKICFIHGPRAYTKMTEPLPIISQSAKSYRMYVFLWTDFKMCGLDTNYINISYTCGVKAKSQGRLLNTNNGLCWIGHTLSLLIRGCGQLGPTWARSSGRQMGLGAMVLWAGGWFMPR